MCGKLKVCVDGWGGAPVIAILYRKTYCLLYAVQTMPWDPGGCTCVVIEFEWCPPSIEEAAKIKSPIDFVLRIIK
jgi:hypothetical protein